MGPWRKGREMGLSGIWWGSSTMKKTKEAQEMQHLIKIVVRNVLLEKGFGSGCHHLAPVPNVQTPIPFR